MLYVIINLPSDLICIAFHWSRFLFLQYANVWCYGFRFAILTNYWLSLKCLNLWVLIIKNFATCSLKTSDQEHMVFDFIPPCNMLLNSYKHRWFDNVIWKCGIMCAMLCEMRLVGNHAYSLVFTYSRFPIRSIFKTKANESIAMSLSTCSYIHYYSCRCRLCKHNPVF